MKNKYLWYTDLHLDTVMPWTLLFFITHIRQENPKGVFLTGDISNGLLTPFYLKLLAIFIKCPIYFVLGNHDYHFSSIEKVHSKVRKLCEKYSNLVWVTNSDVIPLSNEVAIIGTEGWYDAEKGKPTYLKLTFDWWMVKDFRIMPSMNFRMEVWRDMAHESAKDIVSKLEKAIKQGYKNIYIMTHFPPWKEATRSLGTFFEKFWMPYNANLAMGRAIEETMKDREPHVTVLAGHTHIDCWIHISDNIECKVNKAKHFGKPRNEEHIYL